MNAKSYPLFLSIIIIGRNEEENIGRCIQSALDAAIGLESSEVIYVDSASTDSTIEIASKFPIKILQLRNKRQLSPAAGRYLGTKIAHGRFLLYLDGDMAVHKNWLLNAIELLDQNSKMAGVCGHIDDLYIENGEVIKTVKDRMNLGTEEGLTSTFGGAGLYRRRVIDQVGSFNPFIRNMEEAELAIRIRKRNYLLWKIPVTMVDHYTHNRESSVEIKNALKIGKKPGIGQVFRIAYENGFFVQLAKEHFYAFHFIIFLIVASLLIFKSIIFSEIFLFILFGLIAVIVLAYIVKKKSIRAAIVSLIIKIFPAISLIKEFLQKPKRPEEFNLDYVKIK